MTVYPTFQPQNPAINGYSLGWLSCTAYSAAMAASFDKQVKQAMTGEAVRRKTGDTTGGLTLAQVDAALRSGWNIDLATYYRLPWSTFAKLVGSGMGAVLQGGYAPIADSRFDAGRGFRGNHAIFVPPNWAAMDPLADGRYGQAYRYANEPYPIELLKQFAGRLDLDPTSTTRPLGYGYVYAMLTRDRVNTYKVHVGPGAFWVYQIGPDARIVDRDARKFSTEVTLSCGIPKSYPWPGHANRTLVRVSTVRSNLYGQYLAVPQSNVKLETIP
jgi:hypothetical protein